MALIRTALAAVPAVREIPADVLGVVAAYADSQIVVVGVDTGRGCDLVWAYSLATGIWRRLANVPIARTRQTALLGDRLVVSGWDDRRGPQAAFWRHDPVANAWVIAGPNPPGGTRVGHFAVVLNGQLVVGGSRRISEDAQDVLSCHAFHPDASDADGGRWEPMTPLPEQCNRACAIAWRRSDGDYPLLIGGEDVDGFALRGMRHDPLSGTWTPIAPVPADVGHILGTWTPIAPVPADIGRTLLSTDSPPRWGIGSALVAAVPDRNAVVVTTATNQKAFALYHPQTNHWSMLSTPWPWEVGVPVNHGHADRDWRYRPTATALVAVGEHVYVVGEMGPGEEGAPFWAIQTEDLFAGRPRWRALPRLPAGRAAGAVVAF